MMDQDKAEFLAQLRELGTTLTEYVSTNGSDWSIKGFIDIDQNVYTISSDNYTSLTRLRLRPNDWKKMNVFSK